MRLSEGIDAARTFSSTGEMKKTYCTRSWTARNANAAQASERKVGVVLTSETVTSLKQARAVQALWLAPCKRPGSLCGQARSSF